MDLVKIYTYYILKDSVTAVYETLFKTML